MGYPRMGPNGGSPGGYPREAPKRGAKKSVPKLSRLGELLNTQKNVHFLAPPGGPPGAPLVGPKGHPFPWGLFYPFSYIIVLLLSQNRPIFGPILGPRSGPHFGPPGRGGPGGARGGPGGPPGNFPGAPGGPGGPPGGSRRGVPDGGLSGVPFNDATYGLGRVPIRSQSLDGPSSVPNVNDCQRQCPNEWRAARAIRRGGRGWGHATIWHRMCPNFVGPPPPPWAATTGILTQSKSRGSLVSRRHKRGAKLWICLGRFPRSPSKYSDDATICLGTIRFQCPDLGMATRRIIVKQ